MSLVSSQCRRYLYAPVFREPAGQQHLLPAELLGLQVPLTDREVLLEAVGQPALPGEHIGSGEGLQHGRGGILNGESSSGQS